MDKYLSITIIAVALVIAIPTVFALVEPSIIINMEPSQTTKPIQLKDNLGTEVFSVDVNGTIFPEQVSTNLRDFDGGVKIIVFNQISEVAFATDNLGDFNTWNVFATWRIDYNSLSDDDSGVGTFPFPVMDPDKTIISGFLKSSNGIVDATVAIRDSFDGSTWSNIVGIQRDNTVFIAQQASASSSSVCERTSLAQDECFISIRLGTDTATAITATVKDLEVYMQLVMPSQTTLTRII